MRWSDADDDLDDAEYPEEPDESEDDDPTVACPHCRRLIYDDAERCPECGKYLSREDTPWRRPWWLLLGVGLCLAVVVFWVIF